MELYIAKFVILATCCFILTVAAQQKKDLSQDTVWSCVKWTWTGQDVFNRKVICLEWRKEDCSNRLHKEICKGNK